MRPTKFAALVLFGVLATACVFAAGGPAEKPISSDQALPSRDEVAKIVEATTVSFAKAVKANDLKSFYLATSPEFQGGTSFEKFENSYGVFVKDGADLTAVENVQPQLNAEPIKTPSGRLHVNGFFLLSNGRVDFTYEYFHHAAGWQIAGMHIILDMQKKDFKAVAAELRKKALAGDAAAQLDLGLRLHDGNGMPRDDVEAVHWYRKAAEQGNAMAQLTLGYMLVNGEGTKKNEAEGVGWYREAAVHGNAHAQRYLGIMLVTGIGVEKDMKEAALWFRKAAEQGEVVAQSLYASMLEEGNGVPKNVTEAIRWYGKAAAQGDADARKELEKLEHGAAKEK